MPIGRPRLPGTEAERAELRRAKVRANVQAFRKRQREKKLAEENEMIEAGARGSSPSQFTERNSVSPVPSLINLSLSDSSSPSPEPHHVEVATDIEQWLWAIPLEMGVRMAGPSYQDAFIADLEDKSLSLHSGCSHSQCGPKRRLSVCCATWTTSITLDMGKPETDVLMEALLAVSLAIIGRDRRDKDMVLRAAYVQNRALRRFRYALTMYEEGDKRVDETLLSLTALTCAMSEIIANKSWANFNRHLLGVGALIYHNGPEALDKLSAQEHFYGYRTMQTPFLFMNRQRAFLSNSEWIDFPWKKDLELAQQPLHSMLDIALKLLPEIVKQDVTKRWKASCFKERLQRAWDIVAELDEWERRLRRDHPVPLYTKKTAVWQGLHEYAYDFTLLSSATAFTMYTAVRIHVATLIANASDSILSHEPDADVRPRAAVLEALKWSRIACQCIEFFHTGAPKSSGRIVTLWPLETAWELFARLQADEFIDVSKEVGWCRLTAEKLAATGIPPLQWR